MKSPLADMTFKDGEKILEYLREGWQELRMKASADIHMLSLRNFKT